MLNNQQPTTNNQQPTTNKPLIFFLMMILLGSTVYSQKSNPNEINVTPNGILDKVFDQSGKEYALSDLLVEKSGATLINCSTTSYFNLYFEVGSGMENSSDPAHMARRAVVCKVFEDLSSFINSPLSTNGNRVNIWVRNINNVFASPNGVLGLASAFYNLPSSTTIGGIADNEIWKTIHTGVDSYLNSTIPLTVLGGSNNQSGIFFHGMVTFNFNTTNTPAINFNTNLTATTIPAGEFDLYSAVLHEVTHALGFTSLINQDGNSVFGPNFRYYSRYDRLLKTNNSSQFLLTSSACSTMYDYVFNTTLNSTVLHPNPTAAACNGNTLCNDAIKFVGTSTVPVFTPNCFNPISSLSHFEDTHFPTCNTTNPIYGNDNYFLMCNAGNPGMMRRFLKLEERNALCDIGYSVKTTFGSSSVRITPTAFGPFNYGGTTCNGISVAGINDGINNAGSYTFIGNSGTNITINGILSNDTNATGFECLQDLTATATNPTTFSATSGTTATTVTFNSTLAGLHLLRYVPINGLQRGNITYIYVFVQPIVLNPVCAPNPTACNLVSNGDFEQNVVLPTFFTYPTPTDNQFERACGWRRTNINNTPEYHYSNPGAFGIGVPCNAYGNQSDRFPGGLGDGYAGISISNPYPTLPSFRYGEIISTTLSTPLQSNTVYQLKFDVSLADLVSNNSAILQAFISSTPPDAILGGMIPTPLLSTGFFLTSTNFSNVSDGWETVTYNFTTGNLISDMSFLYVGALNLQMQSQTPATPTAVCFTTSNSINNSYYYIDNVSLIATGGASIDLPTSICQSQTLSNLSQYVNATLNNGVFTGTGVSLASGVYSFNATTAGLGTHIISYTYNNNLGCPVTLTDTIIVTNTSSTTIPIDAINDDFSTMPIDSAMGGVTTSVYANDFYNGVASSSASLPNVNFSLVTPITIAGASINSMGLISVPAGTANGTYIITYRLEVIGNCNTSDTATVIIIVSSGMTPNLVAGIRANERVNLIGFQSSGKSIISGSFTKYNNITKPYIARLNTNLTLDTSFSFSGDQGAVDMAIQSDNKIIAAKWSAGFGGTSSGIARLMPDGANDTSFNLGGVGTASSSGYTNNYGRASAIQSDGKILIGGDFYYYNGVQRLGIARLESNGTLDTTFIPTELNSYYRVVVTSIVVQPDGKILLLGNFSPPTPGAIMKNIIRLNSNGSIDTGFTMGSISGSVSFQSISVSLVTPLAKLALQSDGSIIVVGAFTKYNGVNVKSIVKLNPVNGQIDYSFNMLTGVDRAINEVLIEPLTNNIIIGGEFTTFGTTPIKKLIRLTNTGALDATFSIGSGTTDTTSSSCPFCYNYVKVLKQQTDGKIIVGGKFLTFNGLSATNITRIFGSSGVQARSSVTEFQSEPEINTNFETNVLVYPNPSSSIFNIDLTNVEQKFNEVTIYNILGEKVFSEKILPKELNAINLSNLANGYYLAKLFNDNEIVTIKLIKN